MPVLKARPRGSIFANLLETTLKQDQCEPVKDLDQLYRQAAGLQMFITGKVRQWCASSNGLLKVRLAEQGVWSRTSSMPAGGNGSAQHPPAPSAEHIRDEIRSQISSISIEPASCSFSYKYLQDIDEGQGETIWWAGTKKSDRSISKVVLAYGGDASKLVDICRERILFDSIEDMLKCCHSIICDKDIIIKRVKNRMSMHYDSNKTAGFRFLLFNFCIVTPETSRLQLDHHVCEVMLVHRPFYDVQMASQTSHASYIMFRNARALREAGGSNSLRKFLRKTTRNTLRFSSFYNRFGSRFSSFGGSMSQHPRGSQRGSMTSSAGSHRHSTEDIHGGSNLEIGGAHGSGATVASTEWSHNGDNPSHAHQSYRSKKKQDKLSVIQATAQRSERDFGHSTPTHKMTSPAATLKAPPSITSALSTPSIDDTDVNGGAASRNSSLILAGHETDLSATSHSETSKLDEAAPKAVFSLEGQVGINGATNGHVSPQIQKHAVAAEPNPAASEQVLQNGGNASLPRLHSASPIPRPVPHSRSSTATHSNYTFNSKLEIVPGKEGILTR